jgi:hypothetical protein
MYKIYKISDNTNDNVYIGKTKNINHRFRQHRYAHKHKKQECSAKIIFNNEDWSYKVIEETDDKSREAYWIANTPNCINQMKLQWLGIDNSPELQAQYKKEWNQKNKERINQYHKDVRNWKNTWCGNYDYNNHNNLLRIKVESIFN